MEMDKKQDITICEVYKLWRALSTYLHDDYITDIHEVKDAEKEVEKWFNVKESCDADKS